MCSFQRKVPYKRISNMKNQVIQNQILGLFLGSGHQLWVVMFKVAGPNS